MCTSAEDAEGLLATRFPLRILVADGNYTCRRTLVLMLERLGYRADPVENGQECVSAACSGSYDLILLDIDLPIMDGVECTHHIREAEVNTSIVAVTSVPPEVARLECFGAGMNGYIEKPVRVNQLEQALRLAYLSRVFPAS